MTSLQGLLRLLLLTINASVAVTVYAQQPPDPVSSDACLNTAMGTDALLSSGCNNGYANTAAGYAALANTSGGSSNTAVGDSALVGNRSGSNNTAVGREALHSPQTGYNNTALGYEALYGQRTSAPGSNNTAIGSGVLGYNTTGSENTASGVNALLYNSSGSWNTASGFEALFHNVGGYNNVASGASALFSNATGSRNTATGTNGLYHNTTGFGNTASGYGALYSNTIGSNNVAVGSNAGYNVSTGSNNIEIGNAGTAADHGIVRIGTAGTHLATFVAGINNSHVAGSAVYITAGGQLGVLASSERYKTAVATMGSGSQRLKELRPVTFRLKSDAKGQTQYGLIAEEVAKVYPELVIRNEAGQAEGVRYEELTPMLLNELQQQQQELRELKQHVAQLEKLQRNMHH